MDRDLPSPIAHAARLHRARFGRAPERLAVAPGRVNLIGEHVDHAGGPVLPMAIDLAAAVTASAGDPGRVRVTSRELGDAAFPRDAAHDRAAGPAWARAMAVIAERAGGDAARRGLDVTIASDVPAGGGLSSSAAVLVAAQMAIGPAGAPPASVAAAARAIEQDVLGVPCGPMDQLASVLGRAGHVLLLQCDTGAWRHVALPAEDLHLTLIDTGLRHTLADGQYAARRSDLERARRALDIASWPAFAASPDAPRAMAIARLRAADPAAAARARHVTSEISRTHAAVDALERGDLVAFGRCLDAAHASMRDDFDASAPGVEAVRTSLRHAAGDALLGSRLVGAGWGGSVLAATRHPLPAALVSVILRRAAVATGHRAQAIPVGPADGARRIDPPDG